MNSITFSKRNRTIEYSDPKTRKANPNSSPEKTESQRAIQRILLPTDFSSLSRRSYSTAAGLAKKHNAEILLMHIDRMRAPEYSGITNADYLQDLRTRTATESRRVEFEGLSVNPFLRSFRVVSQSIESSGTILGGDIVVASTPASAGLRRLHENDRTELVVANAAVPALLLGPLSADRNIENMRRVLVYGDSVASVASTVPMLRSLVCRDECSIRFLMPRSSMRNNCFARSRTRQFEQDQSFQVALFELAKVQLADFNVEVEFTRASPSEEIRQHSQDLDADLIVLGTNRKYSAAHRTVVRESNCPVLFARSK